MDPLNGNRSANALASTYSPPGPSRPAGDTSGAEPTQPAAHADGFAASPELAEEGGGQTHAAPGSGTSSGTSSSGGVSSPNGQPPPGSTEAANFQHDQALAAHTGSEGCGCPACTSANPTAQLEARDKEVKEHEQQHLAEDGPDAQGGPSFDTVSASNGKQYAVGGKVHVNTSEFPGDPQKTIERMQRIKRASMAPKDPSAQDYATAGQAASKLAKAQNDKMSMDTQKNTLMGKGLSSSQAAQQITLPNGQRPVSTPA
jgi:hypothetical protein